MKLNQGNNLNLNNLRSGNLKTEQITINDSYLYLLVLFLIIDVFFMFAGWLHPTIFLLMKILTSLGTGVMEKYFNTPKNLQSHSFFLEFLKKQWILYLLFGVYFSPICY